MDDNIEPETNLKSNPGYETKPSAENNLNYNLNNSLDIVSDTDSDEYIDLSDYVEDNLKHIFQFQINNEKLSLKYIGKSSDTPDIIIMENFGPKSNMSLYNCVYSHEELETIKKAETNPDSKIIIQTNLDNVDDNLDQLRLFFPIIKLVIKESDNTIISSIAIKLEQEIVFDGIINEWNLYWVSNSNKSEYIKTLKLEKNINPTNILEQIINHSLKNN